MPLPPSLPGLPRVGGSLLRGGGRGSAIQPLLPTQEEIDVAARDLEDEEENLLFRILRVPGRILGGESIKGFLAGLGEEGLGEGLYRAFRDNPLFQILDIIPGVDIAKETDFVDVRKAFGDENVEEGFSNFLINLGGELITSPLELFWTPLGKTATALRSGAKVPASFEQAVDAGMRTMFAFKVPFTEKGFSSLRFRTLDFPTARTVDSVANFLNTNEITSKFMNLFGTGARVGNVQAVPEAGVEGIAGAELRQLNRGYRAEAEKQARRYERMYTSVVDDVAAQHPDIMRTNPSLGKILTMFMELGITTADERLNVVRRLMGGIPFRDAVNRRNTVLKEGFGDLDTRDVGILHDQILEALQQKDVAGLHRTITRYQKNMPETAALPDQILYMPESDMLDLDIKKFLRPGIDTEDTTFGIRHASDLGYQSELAEDLANEGFKASVPSVARATLAQNLPSETRSLARQARVGVVQMLDEAIDAEGEGVIGRVADVADQLTKLAQDVGEADVASGVLRTMTEFYVPRNVPTDIRELINAQFTEFFEGRQIDQLTTLEAIAIAEKQGLKITQFKGLSELRGSKFPQKTVWNYMLKAAPQEWVDGLKARGVGGIAAAEFFDTNPQRVWYDRIRSSARKRQNAAYEKLILEKGSPVVAFEDTLQGLTKAGFDNPERVALRESGYRPFIVTEEGAGLKTKPLTATQEFTSDLQLNELAKHEVAANQLNSWITNQLVNTGKTFKELETSVQRLVDLKVPNIKFVKSTSKASAQNIAKVEESIAALKASGLNQNPLARNLLEQVNLLKRWDESVEDFLPAKKRTELLEISKGGEAAKEVFQKKVDDFTIRERRVKDNIKRAKALAKEKRSQAKRWEGLSKVEKKRLLREADQIEAKRIPKLQERLNRYSSVLEEQKKVVKAVPSRRKELLKEAQDRQKQVLKNLESQNELLRQGYRNAIQASKKELKAFDESLFKTGAERSKKLEGVLKRIQKDINKDFADQRALYVAQRETGTLAFDELSDAAKKRLIESQPDARVAWMDQALHQEFLGADGLLSRISKPDTMYQYLGFMDGLTRWWKGWTTLFPGFIKSRVRDYVTGVAMQLQGGANLVRHGMAAMKDAFQFSNGIKAMNVTGNRDKLKAFKFLTPDGTELRGDQLYDDLYAHGVVDNSLIRDDLYETTQERISLAAGKRAQTNDIDSKFFNLDVDKNTLIMMGARNAEYLDNNSKLIGFFARMRSGMGLDDASTLTRKWAYDPRRVDLSNFERYTLRRFIPFYSWMKTAVSTQVEALLAKPGTLTWMEKAARTGQDASGLSDLEYEVVMPDYIKNNLGIPTSIEEDGTVHVALFGTTIPIADVGRLAEAIQKTFAGEADGGVLDYLGNQANPFLKVPIEAALNRSFYTRREISRFEGEEREFFGASVPSWVSHTLQSLRLLNEINNLNVLNFRDIDRMLSGEGVARRERGGDQTFFERVRRTSLSPIPFAEQTVDVEERAARARGRENVELNLAKHRLKLSALDPERAGNTENIATLRRVIAERQARIQAAEALEGGPTVRRQSLVRRQQERDIASNIREFDLGNL